MKRKWLAALLALTMTTGLLSGCGGGGNNAGSTNTEAPAEEAGSQEESGGVIRKSLQPEVKHRLTRRM